MIRRHGYTHVIPASSQEASENIGHLAHSNVSFVVPNAAAASSVTSTPRSAAGLPPYLGWAYETPASLACLHGLAPQTSGCNPNVVATPAQGGHGVIAIVDAYHAPSALSDLQAFSYQFGLPAPTATTFQAVYASGVQPSVNAGWTLESTLDIEYAHALAPNAKIILVEVASNSYGDLMKAVQIASPLVVKAGGGQVSI